MDKTKPTRTTSGPAHGTKTTATTAAERKPAPAAPKPQPAARPTAPTSPKPEPRATPTSKPQPATTPPPPAPKPAAPTAKPASGRSDPRGRVQTGTGGAPSSGSRNKPYGGGYRGPQRGRSSGRRGRAAAFRNAEPPPATPTPAAAPATAAAAPGTTGPATPGAARPSATGARRITLPNVITVRDLSTLLSSSPINIIRELMKNGVMANINQEIDYETSAIVAADLGFEVEEARPPEPEPVEPEQPVARKRKEYSAEEKARLTTRPPVVTIMGHVDHGKTSLLDNIRSSNVAASEAGAITQHIGAYQVRKQGKLITFLDTPGHEAFTSMGARGARVTDIAVLVVAADDGVQPQTIEAISHARAAQVPIVVALNKIDKPNANQDAVKRELSDAGVLIEEYGGDVICVPVSAKLKTNLDTLLDMILLVAEMADLRADPDAAASGTVVESRMDKAKGPLATLLVQEGTLKTGDYLVIGDMVGKVRAMFDDKGKRLEAAQPAWPAVVLGLTGVPNPGETFRVVADERSARALASEEATRRQATADQKSRAVSLEEFFAQAQAGQVRELNIILKADVQGSIEPIVNSLDKLGDDKIKVHIIHSGIGNISESDINLAVASRAIVIGFSVQVDPAASRSAESAGIDVRLYNIIYRLIDDVDKALKGLLE
ncbi:MAG TPA: translation initiation factor IF-2, partial [Anaerolineae bacterium]|nr:translation initiation factor IF-2 [Anaerolineae bacterium]